MTTAAVKHAGVDAETRVKALIALTEELTDIFVQENDALRARRPSSIAPLQADKARLAAAYAQAIRDIAHDRGLVADAQSGLMHRLKEITREFEATARRQRALLDGARIATEGVARAVAEEAAAEARPKNYGAPDNRSAADAAPHPVAFNKSA